jgi:hypothetical protein
MGTSCATDAEINARDPLRWARHFKLMLDGVVNSLAMTDLCRFGGQLDSILESTEQSGQLHLFISAGS